MVKKILLGLLGLVVLLVAVFFAFGILNPSLSTETRVEIDKPRDVVWKYFTDESKMKEWMPNLKSIEPISGKPLTAGSKFRIVFEEDGTEIVMIETMKEVIKEEVFAFVLENEMINADVRIEFLDKGEKTELVEKNTFIGGNLFWRSLFAITKSNFEQNSAEIYNRLKTNIEKG